MSKRVTSGGAHLRSLAPGQHSSEETSHRWRAVGNSVCKLTCPGNEPRPSSPIEMSSTTKPTDRFLISFYCFNSFCSFSKDKFLLLFFFVCELYLRRPRSCPRTRSQNYVKDLCWSRLGIPPENRSFVADSRDAWRLQLELLSPRFLKDRRGSKNCRIKHERL